MTKPKFMTARSLSLSPHPHQNFHHQKPLTLHNHIMFFPFLHKIFQRIVLPRQQSLVRAATWTLLLTLTVAVVSFVPESVFASAISPSSSFSRSCNAKGFVRLPVDFAGEALCLPAHMVKRSKFDFLVPTVFAGIVVAGSACLVRSFGLGEDMYET